MPKSTTRAVAIPAGILSILLLTVALLHGQQYTLAPSPYQYVVSSAFQIVPNGCIWTYAAGTTTAIATYADTSGTLNGNPIIADNFGRFTAYLLPGTNYKFQFENVPCSSPSTHGALIKTQDNIQGVPASAANVDIVGTAGEALTAGQCAYLSDGSGSKTQGQWYKCDSATTYSSTLPVVGIPIASIALGTSGTLRVAGYVTGLSSLTVGAPYFASTAGALTATAPANRRLLGSADTTTTLVLGGNPALMTAAASGTASTSTFLRGDQTWAVPLGNNLAQGRLTLTTGTPVTTSDVTGASTVYYTPYNGNLISLYDGSATWTPRSFAELSIVLSGLVNAQAYDVFAYDNSGVVALETAEWANATTTMTIAAPGVVTWTAHGLSTGNSITFTTTGALPTGVTANTQYWITTVDANSFKLSTSPANVAAGTFITTSGTQSGTHTGHQPQARATALALQNGVYVKSGTTTRRYLGSFLTTGTTTTEDSASKRDLWNYNNRVERSLLRQESTASWAYTLATWQQANASASNQVECLIGVAEVAIDLHLSVFFGNSTVNVLLAFGIGQDSTNTPLATALGGHAYSPPTTNTAAQGVAFVRTLYPTVGRHFFSWLEYSTATGATTWYGAAGIGSAKDSGLSGRIWG